MAYCSGSAGFGFSGSLKEVPSVPAMTSVTRVLAQAITYAMIIAGRQPQRLPKQRHSSPTISDTAAIAMMSNFAIIVE